MDKFFRKKGESSTVELNSIIIHHSEQAPKTFEELGVAKNSNNTLNETDNNFCISYSHHYLNIYLHLVTI